MPRRSFLTARAGHFFGSGLSCCLALPRSPVPFSGLGDFIATEFADPFLEDPTYLVRCSLGLTAGFGPFSFHVPFGLQPLVARVLAPAFLQVPLELISAFTNENPSFGPSISVRPVCSQCNADLDAIDNYV